MPAARRFLRDVLREHAPDLVGDSAEVCLSELVTNAVLHAGTPVEVGVAVRSDGLVLEVGDGSPVRPRRVPHTRGSATGRGLGLVSALSAEWGCRPEGGGKVVWCRLGQEEELEAAAEAWAADIAELLDVPPARRAEPLAPLVHVRLVDYPVRLGIRAREQFEALRRECQLLVLSGVTERSRAPQRLVDMAEEISKRFAVELVEPERRKLAAFQRGADTVDLDYHVPASTEQVVRDWQAVLEEMDRFCAAESLLTLQAPPDVARLRRWVLEEFHRQLAGAAPRPWSAG